jgi:hypothetical protein
MHGPEHRIRSRRAIPSSAPLPLFFPNSRIDASEVAASSRFRWSRSLVTAFPSPGTITAYAASIPGSKVPACYFAPCPPLPWPVRPFGSTTSSGLPRFRLLHSLKPVANSTTNLADRAFRLHSPSGLLNPSGSKRSAEFAACRLTFRFARSPSAPRRRFYY